MATRKTNFKVVKLPEIAPLLRHAEILGNTEKAVRDTPPASILSITFDQSLAATREMLFASAGFLVHSTCNINQALELCTHKDFDLIVIGHSMPLDQRRFLVRELRLRCDTPLLALKRPGESPVAGVDHVFDSAQSPDLMLEAVVNILRSRRGASIGSDD